MITTIQLSEDLKNQLKKYKKSSKDTYEDVILALIEDKENIKNQQINILREGYEKMQKNSKEINNDFEDLDLEELEKNEYWN